MLKPSVTPDTYLKLSKTAALGQAAQQLHEQATPVPILVNFDALPNDTNHVGVTQLPCVGCGDCVSGCNFHAKSTLIMNYLPDAKNHGAHIFTQRRVRSIERGDSGWNVGGQFIEGDDSATEFNVNGQIVILAAGTLGSTEILLRSAEHGLSLSDQIGCHFSGNGDTIGFAYNTEHVINGVGAGTDTPGDRALVGPCSTAVVRFRDAGDGSTMMVADGAIPGALGKFIAPLFAVEARLVGSDTGHGRWQEIKERYREVESKLFGVYRGATLNTMFFLFIAHDDSMGRMTLQDDRLRVDWPGLGDKEQFVKASEVMRRLTQALDGTYIENPVWNELTNHQMVTGHPVGGCVMADSAAKGVVNHKGQVFSGQVGDAVHQGLYVMDGAVVPSSLGVNPLFTICALAERCCDCLAKDYAWAIDYQLPSAKSNT
jgi:cholesterol oxidase